MDNIEFDQTQSTFTWHIGEIAPGVGIGGTPPLRLAIELGVTPSQSQIGQQPAIIRDVKLLGIDTSKAEVDSASKPGAIVTPEVLKTAKPDVTTNLILISRSGSDTTVATDPGFSSLNATVVK